MSYSMICFDWPRACRYWKIMEVGIDHSVLASRPAILLSWKTFLCPTILRIYSTDQNTGFFRRILPTVLKPWMKFVSWSMMQVRIFQLFWIVFKTQLCLCSRSWLQSGRFSKKFGQLLQGKLPWHGTDVWTLPSPWCMSILQFRSGDFSTWSAPLVLFKL